MPFGLGLPPRAPVGASADPPWTGRDWPLWQRVTLSALLVAALAVLTLSTRSSFPAQMSWLPAGAAVALCGAWGPWTLLGVGLGHLASTWWWLGDAGVAAWFALHQVLLAGVGAALLRWPWRIDLRLGTLWDMARFIAVCALGYALVAGLVPQWLPDPVRHAREDLAEAPRHTPADHGLRAHADGGALPVAPPPSMESHGGPRTTGHAVPSSHGAGLPKAVDWVMADMLGLLLAAPALACALRRSPRRGSTTDPRLALLALAALLAMAVAIYSGWIERSLGVRHTTLLVLPPAVWLALRHPLPYTLFGNLAVVLISDLGTSLGQGPFADHTSGLPLLQLVFVGTTLLITASQSERRSAQDEVQRLATRDALTGLPNRNLLALKLETALDNAQRYRTRVGVLFIDLDHFKRINDSLGHEVGDQLLIAATERLTSVLRADSMLARMGGDEFIAVLEHLEDADAASRAAQRVIAALEHPFSVGPHLLTISCSVGVASYPEDGTGGGELIKHADIAMYQAKDGGRNQFRFFSPAMNAQVQQRLEVENGLRLALAHDAFELHYQPIFDRDGTLSQVEVLVRWRRPDGTLAMPGEFIRIAEETGLIEPIGAWVLQHAARQLHDWRRAGLCPAPIAVNLSARQLRDAPALSQRVRKVLDENGLQACDLVLEITETMLVHLGHEAGSALRQLSQHGVKLALDDFGTGYSSLSYLAHLPIDTLKIDRSFVADMDRSGGLRLVKAMVELAHGLQMRVVAEGVETAAQRDQLQSLQANALQGFLLGRPAPAALFEARHLRAPHPATHEGG